MFSNENEFDILQFSEKITSKFSRNASKSQVTSPQMKFEDIYPEEDGDMYNPPGTFTHTNTSRARIFNQQREIIAKKRTSNDGMVRSSLGSNASGDNEGQYTPAIRQFSAPKSFKDYPTESSEFMRSSKDFVVAKKKEGIQRDRSSDHEEDENEENYSRPVRQYSPSHEEKRSEDKKFKKAQRKQQAASSRRQEENDLVLVEREQNTSSAIDADFTETDDFKARSVYEDEEERKKRLRKQKKQQRRQREEKERESRRKHQEEGEETKDADSQENAQMMVTALPRSVSVDGQAPQINIPLALPVITDMRRFLSQPVPKQCGMIQGYIKRSSGGGVFYPRYTVFMKEGDRFLMSSKKRNYNKTSNYPISMDEKDLNPYGPNYLGKLRSNFLGTEYTIFDDGVSNGKDDKDGDEEKNRESMSSSSARSRCELGAVTYASTFVTAAPRKMQVAIPGVHEKDQKALVWKDNSGPLGESDSLVSRIKSRQFSREEVSCYINKPPRWNESIGGYVLNFGGRVTMASVKNFQLVDPDDQTKIVMQFGKVGKDDFTLDFQFPMSPLQAFAIALSSFDSKIACD